jgi:Flp pilus assembly protein TadD
MKIASKLLISFTAFSLNACLATAPIHPEAQRHNRCGVTFLKGGDLERAETSFRLSLEYNPCHADALHNLALVYLLRGDLDRAEKHEREALECRPDLVQAVNGLGAIMRGRGDLARAEELFSGAVSMDPGYLDARRNLITTALDLGDRSLARQQLDRLALLSPKDPFLESVRQRIERKELSARGK